MNSGYIYILGTKDLNLPLSKIGMTKRTPSIRCAEINKSSTGDLLWKVEYVTYVDDCRKAESLLHTKLSKLRQRGREFFNLNPHDANDALCELMKSTSLINEIPLETSEPALSQKVFWKPKRNSSEGPCSVKHEDQEVLYKVFRERLGVEGRYFGQAGKGIVGISDDNAGVQWNIAIREDTGDVELGVNLEGMKYMDWPIEKFINTELERPTIEYLKSTEFDAASITIGFFRDAWQIASRPKIAENLLVNSGVPLSQWNNNMWCETLEEARNCFMVKNGRVTRAHQDVTILRKSGESQQKLMPVTPHLTIRTVAFNLADRNSINISTRLEDSFHRLDGVYAWVAERA